MPRETNDELVDVLRNMREHAKFFGELGVESVELDSPRTANVTSPVSSAPAPTLTANRVPDARPLEAPRRAPGPVPAKSGADLFVAADPVPAFAKTTETLEQIWSDIGDCTRCGLCEGRTQVVNTHGNRSARLMFVGEAPGADEDAQGKPFVGRAGQLLTKMIEAMGIKRE